MPEGVPVPGATDCTVADNVTGDPNVQVVGAVSEVWVEAALTVRAALGEVLERYAAGYPE